MARVEDHQELVELLLEDFGTEFAGERVDLSSFNPFLTESARDRVCIPKRLNSLDNMASYGPPVGENVLTDLSESCRSMRR